MKLFDLRMVSWREATFVLYPADFTRVLVS
jgi:hypothetical protein